MSRPLHCPKCSAERGVAIPAFCPHPPLTREAVQKEAWIGNQRDAVLALLDAFDNVVAYARETALRQREACALEVEAQFKLGPMHPEVLAACVRTCKLVTGDTLDDKLARDE